MKKIFDEKKQKLPILCWAKNIEESAMEQAINLANHPCVVDHVVLAPDAHSGFGMPIGGVIAVEDAIIPNAVGVDIGCSMSLMRTNLSVEDIDEELLRKIIGGAKGYPGGIRANIPVGMSHNKVKQDHELFSHRDAWNNTVICKEELESAQYQLCSLGGGNHFIEIQAGDDNCVYIMIHSGSRNLGYKVGNYYNKVAEELCAKWKQNDVVKNKLAFLPRGTAEFDAYVREMNICLDFAHANHQLMQDKIVEICEHIIPNFCIIGTYFTRHNYCAIEHHMGRDLFIHRKGAIRARQGEHAIIPGSQGTASYLVCGMGNEASFTSASHGSGRKMSRTAAKANLSLKDEQARMAGIVHNINSVDQLDEAPSAYKDIEEVIKLESDLVTPVVKFKPLAVVKG